MLIMANVPVKVLAAKLGSPWEILLMLGMAAGCFAFSQWLWRKSVKNYTSASS